MQPEINETLQTAQGMDLLVNLGLVINTGELVSYTGTSPDQLPDQLKRAVSMKAVWAKSDPATALNNLTNLAANGIRANNLPVRIFNTGEKYLLQSAELDAENPYLEIDLSRSPGIRIGELLSIMQNGNYSLPRTAHIGRNWVNIAQGAGAELVLNQPFSSGIVDAAAEPGERLTHVGRPFIFDTNETVALKGGVIQGGDNLYLPNADIDNYGNVKPLRLFSWDNETQTFSKVSAEESFLTPLVCTLDGDDNLVPLSEADRKLMGYTSAKYNYFSDRILEQQPKVRDIFRALLTDALINTRERADQSRKLMRLFDKQAGSDGRLFRRFNIKSTEALEYFETVTSGEVTTEGKIEEFINRLLMIYRLAAADDLPGSLNLISSAAELPDSLPRLAKESVMALMASLHVDKTDPASQTGLNVHLHAGALQMIGGYIPLNSVKIKDGKPELPSKDMAYFNETEKDVREIFKVLVSAGVAEPTIFALFPAPVFMLCPSGETFQTDGPLVQELMTRLGELGEVDGRGAQQVRGIVDKWWAANRPGMSRQFASRFWGMHRPDRYSVGTSAEGGSLSVMPEGFKDLQANVAMYAVKRLLQLGTLETIDHLAARGEIVLQEGQNITFADTRKP
jgi:hypothetical protein